MPSFALLLDGAFVIKKLQHRLSHFPAADEIEAFCDALSRNSALDGLDLLRIHFFHARPATGMIRNPIDRTKTNLAQTRPFANHSGLIAQLEMKPHFALRLGETVVRRWKVGDAAMRQLIEQQRQLTASDLQPNISQKGVDLRIGLDIARLSLRQLVSTIVVVTGDSDLIPAFNFARREGIKVYLESLGHSVKRELKVNADLVFTTPVDQ